MLKLLLKVLKVMDVRKIEKELKLLKKTKSETDEKRLQKVRNGFTKEEQQYLTESDRKKLVEIHPIVRAMLKETIIEARKEELSVGLHMGLRSWETQEKLYAKGRKKKADGTWIVVNDKEIVTNALPGKSWHNYGLAGDIVFKTSTGKWTWAKTNPWHKLGEIGEKHGLTWGGRWKTIFDGPHFQYYKGIHNVNTAKVLYNGGGLEAVWKKVV